MGDQFTKRRDNGRMISTYDDQREWYMKVSSKLNSLREGHRNMNAKRNGLREGARASIFCGDSQIVHCYKLIHIHNIHDPPYHNCNLPRLISTAFSISRS